MAVYIIDMCGRLADAAGQELRLELAEEPISIAALRDAARAIAPGQGVHWERVRGCIDAEIVADDAQAYAHQTIALLPPVSGG
ncbi:MAG: hypothetical protein IT553_05005 [Sphingomonadaceae bacterium]|nr:hypothetical protein [Sphingomonadaceae bacterium]